MTIGGLLILGLIASQIFTLSKISKQQKMIEKLEEKGGKK